ncbi:hypothetical protein T4E_5443 [Trichinella pseudospiralis]|uniref:Uncharacterized protein n=1 Tax=Trichinella pseudospiralis TaxID=6337 RepID=A0A0V0XF44_TRIPS|nr:hypothetical protein T4E_5443 [Trichinella pseudospiralis]
MAPDQPIPDPINSEEITAVSSTKPVHRWKKKTVPGGIQNDCISIQHVSYMDKMEEEFLGGLHHAPVKIYVIAPGLSMLQQFCLKKAATGLVKRMQQNWERTTFDMTKCLYCFKKKMAPGGANAGCGKMPAFSLIESSTASAKMPAKLQRRNRPWLGKTLTQCNEKSVWKLNRRRVAEGREEFVRKNTCTLENNRALPWSKCPQCCWEIAEQDVEKRCTIVGRKHLQSSQNVVLVQAENKRILDNRKNGYGKITAATMVASWITSLHYCWVTLTTDVAKCMHSNWKKATPD